MIEFTVAVSHDVEAGVWFVESSDIPGLNAEAETYEALVEIVLDLAPDLIDANLQDESPRRASFPVNVVQHATATRAVHG